MVGQIRSYISYINVDTEDSYVIRIRNMIDNLDDVIDKAPLIQELENKLKEVNTEKEFIKSKEEKKNAEVKEVLEETKEVEQVSEEVNEKTFEEEIAEKIKEYENYRDAISNYVEAEKKVSNDELPDIITTAYNLIKIYTMKIKLLKELAVSKDSKVLAKKYNGMPTIPIYYS